MEPQAAKPRKTGLQRLLGVHPTPVCHRLSHSCSEPHKDRWFSDTAFSTCLSLEQAMFPLLGGSDRPPSSSLVQPLPGSECAPISTVQH